eukprot:scaffold54332_cov54-Phaeocystis_antarctica.AAC.2
MPGTASPCPQFVQSRCETRSGRLSGQASAPPPPPAPRPPPPSSAGVGPRQPAPQAFWRRAAPPPRPWRSSQGGQCCRPAAPLPGTASPCCRTDKRQPLRLRRCQRLLRRHRRGQGRGSLRLRRSGDVQRRLLGRSEEAKADSVVVPPHPCLVRPRLVAGVHSHLNVAKPALAVGAGQREPLHLRLRQRLRCCHWQGRSGAGICLRLGHSGDVQRRLLGRGEAEVEMLALAPQACLVRPRLACRLHQHAAKPALVIGAADQ